jgi:hypothetical protein
MPLPRQLIVRLLHLKSSAEVVAMDPEAKSIQQRLLCAYSFHIASKLESIANRSTADDELEQLLNQNWQLIQGTVLSYTAIPKHETSLLLCDLALYLANKKLDLLTPADLQFSAI